MNALQRFGCVAVIGGLLSIAPVHQADTQQAAPSVNAQSQVYLLRGLLNIFSLGMDSLADKLRPHGFEPTVSSWEFGAPITDKIASEYAGGKIGPIFVIGHSLGANTTFDIAHALQAKGIPVNLVVTFDPTIPQPVPANVRRFINFYAQDGFGHKVAPGPGFTGELDNLDFSSDKSIDHGNIDALDRFHQFVIAQMLAITAPRPAHHPHEPHRRQ
jgi:hypothetical protein